LINVNERPVLTGSLTRNISENIVGPAVIGTPLTPYDDDQNQRVFFSITGGVGASLFTIDPCSGQLFIASGVSFDYETTQSYTLSVTVTDNGVAPITAALSTTSTVTINILDADDAPVFVINSLSATLAENSGAGVSVGTLSVTDQDSLTVAGQPLRLSLGSTRPIRSLAETIKASSVCLLISLTLALHLPTLA